MPEGYDVTKLLCVRTHPMQDKSHIGDSRKVEMEYKETQAVIV